MLQLASKFLFWPYLVNFKSQLGGLLNFKLWWTAEEKWRCHSVRVFVLSSVPFLGVGAPLALARLIDRLIKWQKVSKSYNLFSLASTSILILLTCFYLHLLFVTLFLLNLLHLILYLLPDTCYLTLVTCYLVFSPAICYLILVKPDTSYLASQYIFSDNLYLIPLTISLLPNTYNLILVTWYLLTNACYWNLLPTTFSGHLSPETLYWILST